MARKGYLDKWKKSVEGKRFEPDVPADLYFNELVKKYSGKDRTYLEIGAGVGKTIFELGLPKLYKRVVGIGIDIDLDEEANRRVRKDRYKNVEFRVMDYRELEFKDGEFDVVDCMFAPHELGEISRVLKREGKFILLYPLEGDHEELTKLIRDFHDMGDRKMVFDSREKRVERLKMSGLEVIGENMLVYKLVFRDEMSLREFYEKILFKDIFKDRANVIKLLPKNKNGEIVISRDVGTTVAVKE